LFWKKAAAALMKFLLAWKSRMDFWRFSQSPAAAFQSLVIRKLPNLEIRGHGFAPVRDGAFRIASRGVSKGLSDSVYWNECRRARLFRARAATPRPQLVGKSTFASWPEAATAAELSARADEGPARRAERQERTGEQALLEARAKILLLVCANS